MNIKNYFCLLLLNLSLAVVASAQDNQDYYGPFLFEKNTQQSVFSDTAFVRNKAGGEVSDTLYAFDKITVVLRAPAIITIGQKNAPVYQIQYRKNGRQKTGFLWGGALAINTSAKEGVVFLFTKLSYPQAATNEQDNWEAGSRYSTCAIKAKDKTGLIQQCLYNISVESAAFIDSYRDEDGSIYNPRFEKAGEVPEGAKFLVSFCMSGEACGIPSYFIKAAWNGSYLIRMPLLESVGDAGIFGYDEHYVYPKTKKNEIVIRGKSVSYKEVGNDYVVDETTITNTAVKWDATKREFIYKKRSN